MSYRNKEYDTPKYKTLKSNKIEKSLWGGNGCQMTKKKQTGYFTACSPLFFFSFAVLKHPPHADLTYNRKIYNC